MVVTIAAFPAEARAQQAVPPSFDYRPGPIVIPDLSPGQRFDDHGAAVIVPPAGITVAGHGHGANGEQEQIRIETRDDGTVQVYDLGSETALGGAASEDDGGAPPPDPSTSPGQCIDPAYTPYSFRWTSTFYWWFSAYSSPPELDVATVEQKLRDSVINIISAVNTCGFGDNVTAPASYQGRTTVGANIYPDGTCHPASLRNHVNSVGFGDLPARWVAYTCWWSSNGSALESDVRMNDYDHDFIANLSGGCQTRWSIEGVMTHERGHTFGLDHASPESEHAFLTMSPIFNGKCQNSEASLGKGDIRGLETKY
jgi:Matrixin